MENWQKNLLLGQPDIEEMGPRQVNVNYKGGTGVTALLQAEGVARRTRELLANKGWCLWQCSTLGGEMIAVVRDELVKIPKDYPIYIEAELDELCRGDISQAALRLVHEAKKLTGATVESGTNEDHSDSEVVANSSDDIPHP